MALSKAKGISRASPQASNMSANWRREKRQAQLQPEARCFFKAYGLPRGEEIHPDKWTNPITNMLLPCLVV